MKWLGRKPIANWKISVNFFLKRAWIFACGFKLNRKNIVLYFYLLMLRARKNSICYTRLHFSLLYVFILELKNFSNLSFFIFFNQFLCPVWRFIDRYCSSNWLEFSLVFSNVFGIFSPFHLLCDLISIYKSHLFRIFSGFFWNKVKYHFE